MRRILTALSVFILFSPPALAELTWSGGAGVRYMFRNRDDGLGSRNVHNKDQSVLNEKRWEYRAGIGALAKWENVEAGLDLRTANGITSEWLSTNHNADIAVSIGQAFVRLRGPAPWIEGNGAVTIGRQKTVILYDNLAQNLFDNDTRWNGLGWSWKRDFFGVNLAQYVLGATQQGTAPAASTYSFTEATQHAANTQSRFAVLYEFQPFLEFKIGEDIKSLFAVGFHHWSGTGATPTAGWFNNAVHGGSAATSAGTNVGNVDAVPMDNVRQWQFLSDTSLPYNLRFVAEYVRNKQVNYGLRQFVTGVKADSDALSFSLVWGKPKKAGELGLAYSFADKGIASVVGTFTNGDIPPDNQSHFFEAKYMVADALMLTGKAQFHKEKALVGGDGQPLASPNEKRRQTQQRYEFVGSLAF